MSARPRAVFDGTVVAQDAKSGGRDGKPLAPKTVRHAHVVLRKALGDSERMGLVSRIAAAAARTPSGEHTEMTTWSSEDLRDVVVAAERHPYEIGSRLLAATGLRRGEVLGSRWRDVDFDLGQIAVAHTITEIGADVVMGPPKTARSRRNVYLDRRRLRVSSERRFGVEHRGTPRRTMRSSRAP